MTTPGSPPATAAPPRRLWNGPLGQVALFGTLAATALALHLAAKWLVAADALTNYDVAIFMAAGINVIMAVSLNLVNGITGQFSIGHAGFMAVGAYTSASITLAAQAKLPGAPAAEQVAIFLASLMAGGLLAAVAGYLVGLPSLRLRGDYLAIVTLGFGEIIRVVILNIDSLGGARGLPNLPRHCTVFWVWLLALLTILALLRLRRSDYGRALLAIREDEVAAGAMGIDTTAKKVGAFTIAAFFAGVAGGLHAHRTGIVSTNMFTFDVSFFYVVIVILGGMGSLTGSALGAVLLTILLEVLRPNVAGNRIEALGLPRAADWVRDHDFRISLYALLLILMMILRPHGLFGTREIWEVGPLRRLFRRRTPASSGGA